MVWLDREPCSLKENPFLAKFRCQAGAAEQAVPGLVLLLHLHPLHLQAGVHGMKEGFVFILFLRRMPRKLLLWGRRRRRQDQDTYQKFGLSMFLQNSTIDTNKIVRMCLTGKDLSRDVALRGVRVFISWDKTVRDEKAHTWVSFFRKCACISFFSFCLPFPYNVESLPTQKLDSGVNYLYFLWM